MSGRSPTSVAANGFSGRLSGGHMLKASSREARTPTPMKSASAMALLIRYVLPSNHSQPRRLYFSVSRRQTSCRARVMPSVPTLLASGRGTRPCRLYNRVQLTSGSLDHIAEHFAWRIRPEIRARKEVGDWRNLTQILKDRRPHCH